jgi:hypothetical protein
MFQTLELRPRRVKGTTGDRASVRTEQLVSRTTCVTRNTIAPSQSHGNSQVLYLQLNIRFSISVKGVRSA